MPRRRKAEAAPVHAVVVTPATIVAGMWLDVNQIATLLHCSKSSVYRMVKEGDFPEPYHLGRNMTRWKSDDYLRWHHQKRPAAKPELVG